MSHQWTPGPWEVVKHSHVDGELWLSVNQHADRDGMKEWIAEIKYLATDESRQKANAALIAAAPDLLTAAKFALLGIETADITAGSQKWCVERTVLEAAIAKAEGR